MRNLALMWVLAGACLLGCGGGDKDAKNKAASAADTAAVDVTETVNINDDNSNRTTSSQEKKQYKLICFPKFNSKVWKDCKREYIDIDVESGVLTGSRSRADIQSFIIQTTKESMSLSKAYKKRLSETNSLLYGRITIMITIDEFGKVVSAQLAKSDMCDTTFDNTIVKIVKGWKFKKIDKPGDTTVVVYPFDFSQ
jgi:TonB family protein